MTGNQASFGRIGFTMVIGIVAIIGVLIYVGGIRGGGNETLIETYYDKPVSGLSVGSVVNFRGVKVGEVREISFVGCKYPEVKGMSRGRIYILMALNNKFLSFGDSQDILETIRQSVERGMRATVTASGITGLSRIELDIYHNVSMPAAITWTPKNVYIPPEVSLLDSFSDSATKVMDQINRMDINRVWSNINASVEALSRAASTAKVMMETRQGDLEKIVDDFSESMSAVKDLAAELKRNPSLLIRERAISVVEETR